MRGFCEAPLPGFEDRPPDRRSPRKGAAFGSAPRIAADPRSARGAGNIARRGEERIYHLPFDQQYDSTVIEPDRGELYAATTAEAEELGFRRAWRWRGQNE